MLEADAASTAAFEDQFYGAVAAGPGEYFAVWVDLRSSGPYGISYDLYGQRIGPDGSVGNGGSIELLRDPARMTEGVPAVAWRHPEARLMKFSTCILGPEAFQKSAIFS